MVKVKQVAFIGIMNAVTTQVVRKIPRFAHYHINKNLLPEPDLGQVIPINTLQPLLLI